MDRRDFLLAAGLSTLGALAAACSVAGHAEAGPIGLRPTSSSVPLPTSPAGSGTPPASSSPLSPTSFATTSFAAPSPSNVANPAGFAGSSSSAAPGVSSVLPASIQKVKPWGTVIAEVPDVNPGTVGLTIDDGVSSEVVAAYIELARTTGIRFTFFVNGVYSSWTDNQPALQPFVDSGQIQLGNHTWNHPDITTISKSALEDQLGRDEKFLRDTFGVNPKPFFRPPFFAHNADTDQVCIDNGYSVITWWEGSFADSTLIRPDQVLDYAKQYLRENLIVIGHANFPPVIQVMDQIIEILHERELQTVTLRDVFEV